MFSIAICTPKLLHNGGTISDASRQMLAPKPSTKVCDHVVPTVPTTPEAPNAVLQRLAVEKLRGKELLAVLLADIVYGADVGFFACTKPALGGLVKENACRWVALFSGARARES